MAAPDVRVRLSAEGVDDVVRALDRVQRAAEKTGKAGGKGIGLLNSALGDLQGLLPALSLAAVAAGLGALVKGALDAADAIGKLSQKTGVSAETLSVFKFAGETADASFEQISKGVIKFNKAMGELGEGSTEAGGAVRRLFGSAQALNGLNTEERLLKVVDAIGSMGEGYRKTKTAQDFFGKSGAELIPLLNDLSGKGFEEAAKQAEKLGLKIDGGLAKAAQAANDSIRTLKLAAQGAATQFASGFAPAVASAAQALTEATTQGGVNGFIVLGRVAGQVTRGIVSAFILVGETIAFTINEAIHAFENLGDAAKTAFIALKFHITGNLSPEDLQKLEKNKFAKGLAERLKEFGEKLEGRFQKVFSEPEIPPDKKRKEPKGQPDTSAAKASLELKKAALDNELAIFTKNNEILEQKNKQSLDQQLIDLGTYFDRRRAIIEQQTDKEIETLEKKKVLTKQTPTVTTAEDIKKRQELEAIDAQIKLRRKERVKSAGALEAEEPKATFKDTQDRLNQALSRLDLAQSEIQRQVDTGKIFPFEATERFAAAIKDALPNLQELTRLLREQAVSPEEKLAVDQLAEKIQKLKDTSTSLGPAFDQLKGQIQTVLTSDLANFFDRGISEAKNLEDAFRGLALSVVQSLKRIASEMLATLAIQKLLGFFGGYVDPDVVFASVTTGYASGGLVVGPGTDTSDSIPARLSSGEFVIRSAIVQQPGVLDHLAKLNRGLNTPAIRTAGIARFAEGGLVTADHFTQGGVKSLRVLNFVDPNLFNDHISGPDGEQIVMNHITKNAQYVRAILS